MSGHDLGHDESNDSWRPLVARRTETRVNHLTDLANRMVRIRVNSSNVHAFTVTGSLHQVKIIEKPGKSIKNLTRTRCGNVLEMAGGWNELNNPTVWRLKVGGKRHNGEHFGQLYHGDSRVVEYS